MSDKNRLSLSRFNYSKLVQYKKKYAYLSYIRKVRFSHTIVYTYIYICIVINNKIQFY